MTTPPDNAQNPQQVVKPDTQYEDLLQRVLSTGTPKEDRTGTGTLSLFGQTLRYSSDKG